MSTQEILLALPRLPAGERERVAEALRDLAAREMSPLLPATGQARMAGLHVGAWEVTPDFDAPLPEKFWLGEDA